MEQKKRRWEVPWSSTVSELLGPAASPPPARGRSALHSGEESDRPVDTNRTVTGTSASYLNPQSLQWCTEGAQDNLLQVDFYFLAASGGFGGYL